jgi:hypothetical protein
MRARRFRNSPEVLYSAGLERMPFEGLSLRQQETPMTALIYALGRLYDAFIDARMKQAQVEIKRHKYLQ